jgi:hypothetical protein
MFTSLAELKRALQPGVVALGWEMVMNQKPGWR